MSRRDDLPRLAQAGFLSLFILLFVLFCISSSLFYIRWYVVVIVSLIITALILLFLSLHLRIERLERKVIYLSDKLYSLEHKDND